RNGSIVAAVAWDVTRQGRITTGFVSAQNLMVADGSGHAVAGLMQMDAKWDPETTAALAGGALVDITVDGVGILADPPGARVPGYAVPADVTRSVVDQISQSGKVVHGYLGVQISDEAQRTGGGALITGVLPDSPATKPTAALITGDVIVRAAGMPVRHPADLL